MTEHTAVTTTVVDGHLFVARRTRVVNAGGGIVSEREHRVSYAPGADVSHEDEAVQAAAAAAWTPAVVEAYLASLPAPEQPRPREVLTRDVLERLTDDEYSVIHQLRKDDANLARLWDQMTAGPTVDPSSPKLSTGLNYLLTIAVPTIWPDANTAAQRIAEIFA